MTKIKFRHIGGFWFRVYDTALPFMMAVAWIVSRFNRKLRIALKGRKGGVEGWQIGAEDERPVILFHVASYGELEGVLPVIEALQARDSHRIALSHSSPSAVKAVERLEGLWASGYLPHDALTTQLKWLARLQPDMLMISKHDFWPNTLRAAAMLGIPAVLINANFHAKSQRSFPLFKLFQRRFMRQLTAIWTVAGADAERAANLIGYAAIKRERGGEATDWELKRSGREVEISVMGDARYDRVRQRAERGRERFEALCGQLNGRVLVLGSCWQPEETIAWLVVPEMMRQYADLKLMIVPHEPTADVIKRNLESAKKHNLKAALFSDLVSDKHLQPQVLIVDKIGVLADLYALGWAAYVGGGFGKGVHSVIEPAAHGLPVMFGPNHHVSHEASLLLAEGGGFVVDDADTLHQKLSEWLANEKAYTRSAQSANGVVSSREGATERLLEWLKPVIG